MRTDHVLCVALFPANTGYAWNFIERLYAGIADRLATRGIVTWVAYPSIDTAPRTLIGSAARAVELRVRLDDWGCVWATLKFIHQQQVGTLYVTDLPAWHPMYVLFRLAGIRRIVAHDHTSGDPPHPSGMRRLIKRASRRIPGTLADQVLCVSDFVATRKVKVDLVPAERVTRTWNAVETLSGSGNGDARRLLRKSLGLHEDTLVVLCACRAVPEKGVDHLLRGFDGLVASDRLTAETVLVYMGDGPCMPQLRLLHSTLPSRERIILTGHRSDAAELVAGADICVVPSIWAEAFGMAALEPMAYGIPVVASNIGGLPEVIVDGQTGILVTPGDESALTEALGALIADPAARASLGANGRKRAMEHFRWTPAIDRLVAALGV